MTSRSTLIASVEEKLKSRDLNTSATNRVAKTFLSNTSENAEITIVETFGFVQAVEMEYVLNAKKH